MTGPFGRLRHGVAEDVSPVGVAAGFEAPQDFLASTAADLLLVDVPASDWTDRSTCRHILDGDRASVLALSERCGSTEEDGGADEGCA